MSHQPHCKNCHKLVGIEASRVGLCPACERKSRGLPPEPPKDYCEKHEWPAGWGKPCPDCAELARKDEEIASLKESLRDVLEISEVEGAINLTVMESAKLMAARTLLGPESRFAEKCVHDGGAVPCDYQKPCPVHRSTER